jgi:DNA polymerase alpha-associated DNA helicase A
MRDFDVWKSYIDALNILTDRYSEPFDVIVRDYKNESTIICEITDENQKEKIFHGLKWVFPSIIMENIDFDEKYFLYPSAELINELELDRLNTFADSNYFSLSTKPAFSGTFIFNHTPIIDFVKRHLLLQEDSNQDRTVINYIMNQYPGCIIKEKYNGGTIILDDTFLDNKTKEILERYYTLKYVLNVKGIESQPSIPLSSHNVTSITHSKKEHSLSVQLDKDIQKPEIEEITSIVFDALKKVNKPSPKVILKTILIKINSPITHFTSIPNNTKFYSTQFLTLEELKKIDEKLENDYEIEREEIIWSISKICMSELFINKQYEIAKKYLVENFCISDIRCVGPHKHIHLKNTLLTNRILENFQENTFYKESLHKISYEIDHQAFEEFERTKRDKRIYYDYEKTSSGIILPTPSENVFNQKLPGNTSLSKLRYEKFQFLDMLKHYFNEEQIQMTHQHIFKIDEHKYYSYIKNTVSRDFQINLSKGILSFGFKTIAELDERLIKLRSYTNFCCTGFSESHKFKITLSEATPLINIYEKLSELDFVKSFLNKSENKLRVYGLMSDTSIFHIIRAKIENASEYYHENNVELQWDDFEKGFVKYHFNFDKARYKQELIKKLKNLRGERISLNGSQEAWGKLKFLSYPNITIDVEDIPLPHIDSKLTIKGELKGEKDRIKRLTDTIEELYINDKCSYSNNNLKEALLDSSVLTSLSDGDVTQTKEYIELYQIVESDLLNTYVNKRQIEAIVKSLLSNELFIIQGPPGTGKSTAISELIWQHLQRRNEEGQYRILVTSETNLAVDNALDKLRSNSQLLIKPLRFGNKDKLEREGRRFSLDAINRWRDGNWEAEESLIVDDWITLISNRCNNSSNSSYIKLWKKHLSEKNDFLRKIIHNAYVSNSNVIGATCSSIGKINSAGRFTRFFMEYCNVVFPDEFSKFISAPNRSSYQNLTKKKIEFDLTIQDESSKASPPELALPILFGKKAIVLGDHRQLPPLIDTNEFIESLVYLKNQSNNEKREKEIDKLIEFIHRHRESFEHSHFEKLFTHIDPNLKSTFDTQYRMHPAINETIKQFYKGDFDDGSDLKCGLPQDAVDDPNLQNPMSRYHGFTKKRDTHVMWFDVRTPELLKGTSRINPGEIKTIEWIIKTLTSKNNYNSFVNHWKENEIEQKELGIITFYGAQAGLIRKSIPNDIIARVSPVDRFQGMERNFIIVSLVRSHIIAESENEVADYEKFPNDGYARNRSLGFAESPNRLNVALSRAKRLLIIVGNSKHFSQKEIYKNVFNTIKNHPQGEVWLFDGEKPIRG